MQDGDFVRHTSYPEWGYGRVTACVGDGKCSVRFEDGQARVFVLALSIGKLVGATADQLHPGSRLRGTEWRNAPSAKEKNAACAHCRGVLRRAQYSPAGDWKSCPRCSTRNGTEHVYRRYPQEFGEPEAGSTVDHLEGTQSYCKSCRKGRRPSATVEAALCSELPATATATAPQDVVQAL